MRLTIRCGAVAIDAAVVQRKSSPRQSSRRNHRIPWKNELVVTFIIFLFDQRPAQKIIKDLELMYITGPIVAK